MNEIEGYSFVSTFGSYYPLSIKFNEEAVLSQLEAFSDRWVQYNKSKPQINRQGLSLTSLNGEVTGEIDLNSLAEYNRENGTEYHEMSFRTPTPYWKELSSITEPIDELVPYLGRSHMIRLGEGGFFPPHRDLGKCFRLCAIFKHYNYEMELNVDGQSKNITTNRLCFLDARKEHHVFCMAEEVFILVLNVEICKESVKIVENRLMAR